MNFLVECVSTGCPMRYRVRAVMAQHLGQNVYQRFQPICGSCGAEMMIVEKRKDQGPIKVESKKTIEQIPSGSANP